MTIPRRSLAAALPTLLAACVTSEPPHASASPPAAAVAAPPETATFVAETASEPDYRQIYGAITTERFRVPAVDLRRINPLYLRREVVYRRDDAPGTIVVDTGARYAYFVLPGGLAMRYGVGVGRQQAFNLEGEAFVDRKAEWPNWRPTPQMVSRDPQRYAPYRFGVQGGPGNPLGARALYLYQDGEDTHYRLHGTVEPWTVGTMASAGCVRLINQDIIDLYSRVDLGTRVVILPPEERVA